MFTPDLRGRLPAGNRTDGSGLKPRSHPMGLALPAGMGQETGIMMRPREVARASLLTGTVDG